MYKTKPLHHVLNVYMKRWSVLLVASLAILMFSCKSARVNKGFELTKIVYHTTRCFGWCPVIDMQLDSNKTLIVNRMVFPQGKGAKADSAASGMFTGKVSQPVYDSLVSLLVKMNIDSLKFPNTFCCDAPVVTLIVHHNGKRVYLKSMFPPEEVRGLIDILRAMALDSTLTRVEKIGKIEE